MGMSTEEALVGEEERLAHTIQSDVEVLGPGAGYSQEGKQHTPGQG